MIEGTPLEPDNRIDFRWNERRAGEDRQLEGAIETLGFHRVR